MSYLRLGLIVVALSLLSACGKTSEQPEQVADAPLVVYSSRAEQLIEPLFAAFTAQTGIQVQYVTDSEQPLIQRLKAEGEATPASVLLTVDAGNLWFAASEGVLQPTHSPILESVVPAVFRDPQSQWFGMSLRARTIVYDSRKLGPQDLSDYADLANEKWRGRLCLRTSKKVYNQSLIAMLIAQKGEAAVEQIVRGWVANLATDVFANDTKLLQAIATGQCEVGIVNTYYLGRLIRDSEEQLPIGLFWPAAQTGGVHVNVSGAGITRHAPNPTAAKALLEWFVSENGQAHFANDNLEFPVRTDVAVAPIIAAWGAYSASQIPLVEAGRKQADAVRLMDRAGYH